MDMRVSCTAGTLLLITMIASHAVPAGGRRLHLGDCPVTAHFHELWTDSKEMQQAAVKEDKQVGVQLLSRRVMKELLPLESCCFLKHLLDFYVEKVFSSYTVTQPKFRRNTSNLANSFLGIKKDLHQCHTQTKCQCGGEARVRMGAIQDTYSKMEPSEASVKAIGELDTLLDWMKTFGHSSTHKAEETS